MSLPRLNRLIATSAAVAALSMSLTACEGLFVEHMCSEGEYPAWVPFNTGRACFADDEEPTAPYVRYPIIDVPDLLADDYEPLKRYPVLKDWAKDYRRWYRAGATGEPPAMPAV